VEREALVRALIPFNFGAGTKGLSPTWSEMAVVAGPPLVPIRITNRDKRGLPTVPSGVTPPETKALVPAGVTSLH
jgi:hypothetical protein